MKILWTETGWAHYLYWQNHDPKMVAKINELLRDTVRQPFQGLGKPEPLRNELKGWWSRRVSGEHRLIYRVTGTGDSQADEVSNCRFHYEK